MKRRTGAVWLLLGVAACATPGQVRRVETQVAIGDRERARADSAHSVEVARLQASQRLAVDSMTALMRELNDNIQRVSREGASNFEDLRQRLYQVATLSGATQSQVAKLRTQVETAVTSAPPAAGIADTGHAPPGVQIPTPDALILQAGQYMDQSAYPTARNALNTLLRTYPNSPQVAEALFMLGKSFDPTEPDSARVYYVRTTKAFPQSTFAPTALFKLGDLELRAHNLAQARAYWQQIVSNYKTSDEFESAQARLHDNP